MGQELFSVTLERFLQQNNPSSPLKASRSKVRDDNEEVGGVEEEDHAPVFILKTVEANGSVSDASNPIPTIKKAFSRLNFSLLRSNSSYYDEKKLETILENLDTSQVEMISHKSRGKSFVFDLRLEEPYKVFRNMNLVGFDGASLPLFNANFSIVYARAASFAYSQKDPRNRLSFESGANRLWADIALNVASKPGIVSEEVRRWQIDLLSDDLIGQLPFDRVDIAELQALSIVESAAIISCVEHYKDSIDLIFHDGPLFSKTGFDYAIGKIQFLKKKGIGSINIVKTPIASPVMRACGITDTTDVAFFDLLPPGHRSPFFLKKSENFLAKLNEEERRSFFYYKTMDNDLIRVETPYWFVEEKGMEKISSMISADSDLNGGKLSFMISKADAFVRIGQPTRRLLRLVQKTLFEQAGIEFTEPYDTKRWRGA